jgi:hypothetical protein
MPARSDTSIRINPGGCPLPKPPVHHNQACAATSGR